LAELLYWSEKKWRVELMRSTHSYRLFKAPLAAKLERWHLQQSLRYAFAAIVVSGSVQFTLMPLLVIHFHRISIAALVLNIGVSILMMLMTVSALVALPLNSLSAALAMPFIETANALNWLMVNSVVPFAQLRIASLRVPEYSGKAAAIYVLYFVPLLLLAIRLAQWRPVLALKKPANNVSPRRVKLLLVTQWVLVVLLIMHPFSERRTHGKLRIDFLDVGQGDSALLQTPDGSTILIDGGGRPVFKRSQSTEETFERDSRSIGDAVVSEFLWTSGLDGVDYILPTHADADHIDGLRDVLRSFNVRAALVGRIPKEDPEFDLFHAAANEQSVPITTVSSGDRLQFGEVSIDVLWPADDVNGRSQNNDSVVLRITFGRHSILMTGDIEVAAESALLRMGYELHADVVKVAHHGSKTSSIQSFVSATGARLALISVGRKSMFGHPHADVLERWRASGAEVLTTGKCGTITVETDGKEMEVSTFVQNGDCRY
jgi:competence protein ComEC